jgi:hypothetical protein
MPSPWVVPVRADSAKHDRGRHASHGGIVRDPWLANTCASTIERQIAAQVVTGGRVKPERSGPSGTGRMLKRHPAGHSNKPVQRDR